MQKDLCRQCQACIDDSISFEILHVWHLFVDEDICTSSTSQIWISRGHRDARGECGRYTIRETVYFENEHLTEHVTRIRMVFRFHDGMFQAAHFPETDFYHHGPRSHGDL